jgi:hypothetical protein
MTSAIVGGGPSFHRLRNTTGGITAATMSIMKLTKDEAPSAKKTSKAHAAHRALKDHLIGGYAVKNIMAGTLLRW